MRYVLYFFFPFLGFCSSFLPSEDSHKELKGKGALSGQLLYFKPIETAITYALRTPNPEIVPLSDRNYVGNFVLPEWKYSPGVRLQGWVPMRYDDWEIGGSWTLLRNHSKKTVIESQEYDIYTTRSQIILGVFGNGFVKHVFGEVDLRLNGLDLFFQKKIPIGQTTILYPIFGLKGAHIKQAIHTLYADLFITSPLANSPRSVFSKNKTWGIGPLIGMGMDFTFSSSVHLDFLTTFSSLSGKGNSQTVYSDFLNLSPRAFQSYTRRSPELFSTAQIKIGIEKSWSAPKFLLKVGGGWETQVWFNQLKINDNSNVENPSVGSTLTLQGPFFRFLLEF